MDTLSSQSNLAGYRAVLEAAYYFDRGFPMLMTAAGTVNPAKLLVIGAGVAGLQAIATAKRLGASVSAYDVRAATKEQVESLGAKFIYPGEIGSDAAGKGAEDKGGYITSAADNQLLLMAGVEWDNNQLIARNADTSYINMSFEETVRKVSSTYVRRVYRYIQRRRRGKWL